MITSSYNITHYNLRHVTPWWYCCRNACSLMEIRFLKQFHLNVTEQSIIRNSLIIIHLFFAGLSKYGVYSLFPGGPTFGSALYSHASTIGRFASGHIQQSSGNAFHAAHKGKNPSINFVLIRSGCRLSMKSSLFT